MSKGFEQVHVEDVNGCFDEIGAIVEYNVVHSQANNGLASLLLPKVPPEFTGAGHSRPLSHLLGAGDSAQSGFPRDTKKCHSRQSVDRDYAVPR